MHLLFSLFLAFRINRKAAIVVVDNDVCEGVESDLSDFPKQFVDPVSRDVRRRSANFFFFCVSGRQFMQKYFIISPVFDYANDAAVISAPRLKCRDSEKCFPCQRSRASERIVIARLEIVNPLAS